MPGGNTSGTVSSCGASNFSGCAAQLRRQVGERRVVGAGQQAAAEVRPGGHRVEPGHRLHIGLVVLGLPGHQLVEVADLVGVDEEVRGLHVVEVQRRAQHDPGEPHAADRGPEQLGVRAVRGERVDLAVRGEQVHRPHVVAEAALDVVGLAVDVAADRAADGDLPGAGQHGQPQPEREQRAHQRVERDAGVDLDQARVGVHPVDAVQRGHVDDDAARVLRRVAVAAARARGRSRPAHRPPAPRSAIASTSVVRTTCAVVGAVRPQPVSLASSSCPGFTAPRVRGPRAVPRLAS